MDAATRPADAAFVCAADFECDDGAYCTGTERCVDAECQAGDPPCDASTHRCDEADEVCTPIDCTNPDVDGDGHDSIACGGGDCDDDDDRRNPGNMEICDVDDVDEDSDPLTYGFRDADMDGDPDARCCNGENCGTDCDELNPAINPDATEACDEVDNNCSGAADEGLPTKVCYRDMDADGYGETAVSETRCACGSGWATLPGDCADWEPRAHPGVDFRGGCYCELRPPMACGPRFFGPETSADWNCDGREERRWTGTLCTCGMFVDGGCTGAFETLIWDSVAPPCGFRGVISVTTTRPAAQSGQLLVRNAAEKCERSQPR